MQFEGRTLSGQAWRVNRTQHSVAPFGSATTIDSGFTGSTVDCCSNYCPTSRTFQGRTVEQCCGEQASCNCSWTHRFLDPNADFWVKGTHWRFFFEDLEIFRVAWRQSRRRSHRTIGSGAWTNASAAALQTAPTPTGK
ncbi:MAG: hypothetical protein A2289_12180 [Deltaproteobacteria bacterium RIFOXYA12_FULL_58_15]|nr:MAG: hypothetical protein A2289_12180 [Deltaproteobacteria bacterium RIFOXYA12_FULL_58_15]